MESISLKTPVAGPMSAKGEIKLRARRGIDEEK
jgi:hypothetical protein